MVDSPAYAIPMCLQLTREVLDIAAAHIKPGVTTDFIDEIVHNATIERNAYPSPLNYRNFPKSVCTYVALPTFFSCPSNQGFVGL